MCLTAMLVQVSTYLLTSCVLGGTRGKIESHLLLPVAHLLHQREFWPWSSLR